MTLEFTVYGKDIIEYSNTSFNKVYKYMTANNGEFFNTQLSGDPDGFDFHKLKVPAIASIPSLFDNVPMLENVLGQYNSIHFTTQGLINFSKAIIQIVRNHNKDVSQLQLDWLTVGVMLDLNRIFVFRTRRSDFTSNGMSLYDYNKKMFNNVFFKNHMKKHLTEMIVSYNTVEIDKIHDPFTKRMMEKKSSIALYTSMVVALELDIDIASYALNDEHNTIQYTSNIRKAILLEPEINVELFSVMRGVILGLIELLRKKNSNEIKGNLTLTLVESTLMKRLGGMTLMEGYINDELYNEIRKKQTLSIINGKQITHHDIDYKNLI